MAIRGVSLLDMDFSKELVRRSVLWLHQVECDVHQRYGLGEALPRLSHGCTRFWSIRPFHRQRRLHLRYDAEKEEGDDSAIWCNKLVDIQKQYKIVNNGPEKDSVVDLVETIIDP